MLLQLLPANIKRYGGIAFAQCYYQLYLLP